MIVVCCDHENEDVTSKTNTKIIDFINTLLLLNGNIPLKVVSFLTKLSNYNIFVKIKKGELLPSYSVIYLTLLQEFKRLTWIIRSIS